MNVGLFLLLWFASSVPAALVIGAALKRLDVAGELYAPLIAVDNQSVYETEGEPNA